MAKIRFLLVEPSADKPPPLFAFLSFNGQRIKVYAGRRCGKPSARLTSKDGAPFNKRKLKRIAGLVHLSLAK